MNDSKAANAIESICFQVAKLDAKQQSAFIDSLRGVLTETELNALQIGIAYFRLLIYDDLRDAMKAALSGKLYQEFRQQLEN